MNISEQTSFSDKVNINTKHLQTSSPLPPTATPFNFSSPTLFSQPSSSIFVFNATSIPTTTPSTHPNTLSIPPSSPTPITSKLMASKSKSKSHSKKQQPVDTGIDYNINQNYKLHRPLKINNTSSNILTKYHPSRPFMDGNSDMDYG